MLAPAHSAPAMLLPAGPCPCVKTDRHLAQQIYPMTTVQMSPGIYMCVHPLPSCQEGLSSHRSHRAIQLHRNLQWLLSRIKLHLLSMTERSSPAYAQPNFPDSPSTFIYCSQAARSCSPLPKDIVLSSCLCILFLARHPRPTLLIWHFKTRVLCHLLCEASHSAQLAFLFLQLFLQTFICVSVSPAV